MKLNSDTLTIDMLFNEELDKKVQLTTGLNNKLGTEAVRASLKS